MTTYKTIFKSLTIKAAALACLLGLGGFLLWASLAPLEEGLVVYGSVEVESKRKIIQHLEGGIIQKILVKEGDLVEKGAALIVLADVSISAGRNQLAQQLENGRASVARLQALIAGEKDFTYTARVDDTLDKELIDEILNRQIALFKQQKRTLGADLNVLKSRKKGLIQKANTVQGQIDHLRQGLDIIATDLKRNRSLFKDRMVTVKAILSLELEEARMKSESYRLLTDQGAAYAHAKEISNQIIQAKEKFLEGISADLVEARNKVLEIQEHLTAAQDVLNRTIVYAPQSGKVLNLSFTTTGGVVRPGEHILEIVPSMQNLIAVIEISPGDRDAVYEHLSVKARFPGLHSWRSPPMEGIIEGVSADLKISPRGDYSYFEARVFISAENLAGLDIKIVPGMPIEVFISSGRTRTFLDYLMEPISATLRKGARS